MIATTKALGPDGWVDVAIVYDANRIHDLASKAVANKTQRATEGALTAYVVAE
jgi:hypothetical protein